MHVPNNNTSQFFITTKARTHALGGCTILHFDGRHVIFGRVVEGMG
jgi:cyclophilin family peptidyl-prolyl cis-trans isomerase